MNRRIVLLLFLAPAYLVPTIRGQDSNAPPVKDAQLGNTRNVHACGKLFLAGQPSPGDLATIKARGIQRVVTLRTAGEINWDEEQAVKDLGLTYLELPFRSPDALTDEFFARVRRLLDDSAGTPTLLHCGSANRVGAVWLTHRVLDQDVPLEVALQEARTIGLRSPAFEAKAIDYVKRHSRASEPAEKNVRPGINDRFVAPDLKIEDWLGRFEIESREVFAARHEVAQACGVRPGSRVADIGAGTGIFTRLFAEQCRDGGWVYAVDISTRFLEHINQRATEEQLTNVTAVLGTARSVGLPPHSIDVAFVCDTYHHFEYPQSTLASIHRALKPGGTLVVVDFERIEGVSREFILGHVRAGKQEFRGEIELAGFDFLEEIDIKGLRENYLLRFQKRMR